MPAICKKFAGGLVGNKMESPRYLAAIRSTIDRLESTQLPAIESAASIIVESLSNGGAVFCSEIGHGNHLDFLNRAGGLAAVQQFCFSFSENSTVADALKKRPRAVEFHRQEETIRFALRASNLRAGDVLLIGSVSGKNAHPIELAIACREMGVKVIGLTSMAYTNEVASQHPSGKKLFEVVDVVIDNGAPFGDAAVDIDGFDFKLLPVSGATNIIAGWVLWELVIVKMTAAGMPPSVFMSINRPGGQEYYDKSRAEYMRRGY